MKLLSPINFRIIFWIVVLAGNLIAVYSVRAELVDDVDESKNRPVKVDPPANANDASDLGKAKLGSTQTPSPSTLPMATSPTSSVAPANSTSMIPPQVKPIGDSKTDGTKKSKNKSTKVGIVKFWSKSLSGFKDQGSVTLEEDVIVTQDDIRLEADKATILWEPGGKEVKEVICVGNVKFSRVDPETGMPIKGEAKEAVFDNEKRMVTMKGDPVLYRGDDTVKGKVIHYDLTNGWIQAIRVEGVVQPTAKKAPPK